MRSQKTMGCILLLIIALLLLVRCELHFVTCSQSFNESVPSSVDFEQDLLTAYALAGAYEENATSDDSIIQGAPSVSSINLASKWINSVSESKHELSDDTEDSTEDSDQNRTESPMQNEDRAESTKASPVLTVDNATVLQLLLEQVQRDFAPIIFIINFITPTPVKKFLATQFAELGKQLKLVFGGAFSPLLSVAAKASHFVGKGFIFLSEEILKLKDAYEVNQLTKNSDSALVETVEVVSNPTAADPIEIEEKSTIEEFSDRNTNVVDDKSDDDIIIYDEDSLEVEI